MKASQKRSGSRPVFGFRGLDHEDVWGKAVGRLPEGDDLKTSEDFEVPLIVGDDFFDSGLLQAGGKQGVEEAFPAELVAGEPVDSIGTHLPSPLESLAGASSSSYPRTWSIFRHAFPQTHRA